MKQLTAILLLLVLLVNALGYRLILACMENRADSRMIARIDRQDYDESELLEISAPLELPYFTNWKDFERCDGQVTINGTVYNYVARKYVNNVMIYKCIPNRHKQQVINTQKAADHITFNGTETGNTKKNESPLSSYFKTQPEYDDKHGSCTLQVFTAMVKNLYPPYTEGLVNAWQETQHRPPAAC